ncbi:hypothetical protein FHW85_002538 [Dyella sp. SG609]|nr:hypothetical protein [Dyella sp. SG609]
MISSQIVAKQANTTTDSSTPWTAYGHASGGSARS